MQLDLVVVGNLAIDDVVYEDGSTRMRQPGGACLYVALAAQLTGATVGVVSRAGTDYPRDALAALAERGIDLGGVQPLAAPGLRTWLLYEGGLRRLVHRLDGTSHHEASPSSADIPAAWESRAMHLAPMPFDRQLALARASSRDSTDRPLLSLDPFELLSEQRLGEWQNLLAHLDILFLGEDEIGSERLREQPRPFLRELAAPSGPSIVYKRGARGGIAYDARDEHFHPWQGRVVEVCDPTGAGDAFAGGVLAALVRGDSLPRALRDGVVAASFALEAQGAEGLLGASREAFENRKSAWFGP